jgi:hypothetical protein
VLSVEEWRTRFTDIHGYTRCVTRQCTARKVHKATTPRLLVEPCQVSTYRRQNEVSNTCIWKFNMDLIHSDVEIIPHTEYRIKLSPYGKVWQDLPCHWKDLSAPRLHSHIASDSGILTPY